MTVKLCVLGFADRRSGNPERRFRVINTLGDGGDHLSIGDTDPGCVIHGGEDLDIDGALFGDGRQIVVHDVPVVLWRSDEFTRGVIGF